MFLAQHSILSNIACAMSVSAPLTDIWGVTKSRPLQGNSVCRRNRHGRAVVPNVMASRTAILGTEMKSAVGMIKRFFVVKLKPAHKDRHEEFNWLSLVVNQTGIIVLKEQHYPPRCAACFECVRLF
jgi:hypothetical protein